MVGRYYITGNKILSHEFGTWLDHQKKSSLPFYAFLACSLFVAKDGISNLQWKMG